MEEVISIDAAMEVEALDTSSSSSSPNESPPENHSNSTSQFMPKGTVVPNRIFVGGIDTMVNENDLRAIFSKYGIVRRVKIMTDYSGTPKGYGFVTFENEEDALKILHDKDGISLKDKKLNIGQAVYKRQTLEQTRTPSGASPDYAMPVSMSCGSPYFTTSSGFPYTFHDGVAYFHCSSMSPHGHQWPNAAPVMLPQSPQPAYQQPVYQQYQYVPNGWNVGQPPLPSNPGMYSHLSEYVYQPTDESSVQETMPDIHYSEPTMQPVYPVYPQSEEMMPPFPQDGPRQSHMFSTSRVHLRYRRYTRPKGCHYLQ